MKPLSRISESPKVRQWLLVLCILAITPVFGSFWAIGHHYADMQWYAYSMVALVLTVVVLMLRDVDRFLMAVMVITIPHGIYLELARRRVYGVMVTSWEMAAVGLMVLWALRHMISNREAPLRLYWRTTLPFLALIITSALTVLVTNDKTATALSTYALVRCLLLYVAILVFVKQPRDMRFVVDLIVIMLLLYAIKYIIEVKLGFSIDFVGRTRAAALQNALGGNARLIAANAAGGFLACLCALTLGRFTTERRSIWRAVEAIAFVLGVIALILTLSRGGWLAFGLAVGSILALVCMKGMVRPGAAIALIGIGVMICLVGGSTVTKRVSADDGGAAMSRVPLMRQAVYMVSQNPVLGVGAGTYRQEMQQYVPPDIPAFWQYNVHNYYLLVWAERGTIGFLAFLWFILVYVRLSWRCFRKGAASYWPLGLMALGFFVALANHMFFEGVGPTSLPGLVWVILLAMLTVASQDETCNLNSPFLLCSAWEHLKLENDRTCVQQESSSSGKRRCT